MPRSRKNKTVSLTKTKKKGLESRQSLIQKIRESVDAYERIFLLSIANMRATCLAEIRSDLKKSRMYFGKNKVMIVAMGRTAAEAYAPNIENICDNLTGQMGILFTDQSEEEVINYFESKATPEFARTGHVASHTVIVSADRFPQLSHAIEPHLRQLGLPTKLEKGIIHVTQDFVAAKKGSPVTAEQARILKLFGYQLTEFKVVVTAAWDKETGAFRKFDLPAESAPNDPELRPCRIHGGEPGAQKNDDAGFVYKTVDPQTDTDFDDNAEDDNMSE